MGEQYSSRPETGQRLPEQVVRHVLWHYGDYELGVQPGSFTGHLMRAIGAADAVNRGLLQAGFPNYVEGLRLANVAGGYEHLRALAKGWDADVANQLDLVSEVER